MSFVERFIILCPYLGVSTIGGFTVYIILYCIYNVYLLVNVELEVPLFNFQQKCNHGNVLLVYLIVLVIIMLF